MDLAAKTASQFSVGTFTCEYTVGNYLAFYQDGKLTDLDLNAHTATVFTVGAWTDEIQSAMPSHFIRTKR